MGLTARRVRDAKPGDKTRIEWDDEVPGLGLRITAAGVKSFIVNFRVDGRERRMTLGRAADLSLPAARDRAREVRLGARDGGDPLEDQRKRKQAITVNEALDRFVGSRLPERIKIGRMAESTAKEYRRQINKHLRPALGSKRLRDVERRDVQRMTSGLPPIEGNRVLALTSAFFNWCEKTEVDGGDRRKAGRINPTLGIDKSREEERDRVLSADELTALGKALDTMTGNDGAILAIRLAALTGLRIGEIRTMRWEHVDMQSGAVVLPWTKTGRRIHTLPSAALALLADTKRVGACVIPGRDADQPLDYRSIQRHFARACEAAGIHGARLHDLRRTIMTEAAAAGTNAHLLRDMVGHKTTAMADRYIRRANEPLKDLRERMGAGIAAKMGGQVASDVVPLAKQGKS